MILEPATYLCPTHGTDLTDQVHEQLEDDDWPFAYNRHHTGRDSPNFEVVASCPGTDTPHSLTCRGTVHR